jgi:hypothetical protein
MSSVDLKSARSGSIRISLTGLGLIIILMIGYTWATWRFFTERVPGGNDLLAHITAWEAYLQDGVSPYSDEAALHTQRAIRGRPALPGEDENRMTYPFYSVILHGPLVFIDYAVARAIYMTLLQSALIVGVIMMLDLIHWRPPTWLMTILLAWSVLFYPAARGILLGQFAILGFFSLVATLHLLRRHRDVAAGSLLVLSTVKPTLVFLAVPFLMLWGLVRQRRRFVFSFLGTLAALSVASMIALPTWISELVLRVRMYSSYTVGQSPVWLLTHAAIPVLGHTGELALSGLLVLMMLVTWFLAIRPGGDHEFYWVLGVTLIISNLIVPRSATTNYVLLLVPLLWGIGVLDRRGRLGRMIVLFILFVSSVGLWWLHLVTVDGNQEQAIMFIPIPVLLGLTLTLGRRWFIRDARLRRVRP